MQRACGRGLGKGKRVSEIVQLIQLLSWEGARGGGYWKVMFDGASCTQLPTRLWLQSCAAELREGFLWPRCISYVQGGRQQVYTPSNRILLV